jgi:hypothetical protein
MNILVDMTVHMNNEAAKMVSDVDKKCLRAFNWVSIGPYQLRYYGHEMTMGIRHLEHVLGYRITDTFPSGATFRVSSRYDQSFTQEEINTLMGRVS